MGAQPVQERIGLVKALEGEYSQRRVCRALAVPRSSVRYAPRPRPAEVPPGVKAAILALRLTYVGCGVRPMYHLLNREGHVYARAMIRRAFVELGILNKPAPRKVKTTNSKHGHERHPNLLRHESITRPHQAWVGDVTYIRLPGKFAHLALLMDSCTRLIVGWGTPEIHHSDQGANYASDLYTGRLKGLGVRLSMAARGKPHENGQAERLNRTLKEEEVRPADYRDFEEARVGIGSFIHRYSTLRLHSALKYATPMEALTRLRLRAATP